MIILDPGHIYKLDHSFLPLTFIKRGGGAVTYEKEWPGVQTQAVMRAIIDHLEEILIEGPAFGTYELWQLGSPDTQPLTLGDKESVCDVLTVLIDRSYYLNSILQCVETVDACQWLDLAKSSLNGIDSEFDPVYCVEMALWNYEARAYRRKTESVNRKQPEHDDSARLRPWRYHQAEDVPFNEVDIASRPIGQDGHILLS